MNGNLFLIGKERSSGKVVSPSHGRSGRICDNPSRFWVDRQSDWSRRSFLELAEKFIRISAQSSIHELSEKYQGTVTGRLK